MKKRALLLALLALTSLAHAAPNPKENAVTQSPSSPATTQTSSRIGPAPVAALLLAGIRYEAVDFKRGLPQNGGYIEAFDAASGKSLWLAQVYAIDYQPGLERDVQDVFIRKIEAGAPGQLLITDERGRRFTVELATRRVTAEP